MFDTLSIFVNDISDFELPIPLELQISAIIVIIVALCVGAYFLHDIFDISTMRGGFSWFIFIAVLNLTSILIIFLYYNSNKGTYKGTQGKAGGKGKIGKKGKSVSCNFCKNNIYIQKVRQSNVICRLDKNVKAFIPIFKKEKYFNDILEKGNNIDYESFVNNIILSKATKKSIAIDNFNSLMNINSIAVLLIKAINKVTKASLTTYGTFRNPNGKVGYLALGDSVYGGLEDKIELNSFMLDGNILYPSNYTQLVSFKSHNEINGDVDTYTIWRPNGQSINEKNFEGKNEEVKYSALGDICRFGINQPKLNESPTISIKCLDAVSPKDLTLVFVYVGNINVKDETKYIDYSQTESYLIENESLNEIEIFSVWRTPMNSFITNCNSQNNLVNNSVVYNIINDITNSLNKYGYISSTIKKTIAYNLTQTEIPKIVTALLCKYYEIELLQDIVYYINRYRTNVPEFKSINTSKSTLGDLMNKILKTKNQYTKYNEELMKKANFTLQGKKRIQYNEKNEKHLPNMILKVYETAQTKLLTIPFQIENINTLLDLINIIFENGLETKIAVDSDGVAQGGVFMNSLQEMLLRVCKMCMPPSQPAYTIKDECLGTFALDREREEVIKLFTEVKTIYFKLTENINNNSEKFEKVILNINQYQKLMLSKIGQLCGHIDNYNDKISNSNLEEFTTTRIKGLVELYINMNSYLNDITSKR